MNRLLARAMLLAALLGLMGMPAHAQDHADPLAQAARRQVLVMLRLPAQHFRPDASYGGGYLKDGCSG
jgi:hypothetical protein